MARYYGRSINRIGLGPIKAYRNVQPYSVWLATLANPIGTSNPIGLDAMRLV